MLVRNVSTAKIHVIVESGSHIVPSMECFDCSEKEFMMLSKFFKLEAVEEKKVAPVAEPVAEPVAKKEEPKVVVSKPKAKKIKKK